MKRIKICVRWQNPFFEAGAVKQQSTFQPDHLVTFTISQTDFDALMEVEAFRDPSDPTDKKGLNLAWQYNFWILAGGGKHISAQAYF